MLFRCSCFFIISIFVIGYISLWTKAGNHIASHNTNDNEVNVCVGTEWYYFPSHFFLPSNAKLQYIEEDFHGILPQHFAVINGTKNEPLQPFNNMNKEERTRYIERSSCEYIIASNSPMDELAGNQLPGYCTLNNDQVILQQKVLHSVTTGKEWTRAFEIPDYSKDFIQMKPYQLLTPGCKAE